MESTTGLDLGSGGTCSAELLREVAGLLHSRGREATPGDVKRWAEKMVDRMREWRQKETTADQWLQACLDRQTTATMCLHLHFGDAM